MKKNIVLLILISVLLSGYKPKKRMFKTTNGKNYSIRTSVITDAVGVAAPQFRPYLFLRDVDGQQKDPFFNTGLYSGVFFPITLPKPIVPLYVSMLVYNAATLTPVMSMSTPFLCELGELPTAPPFAITGSTRYTQYAEKIAPHAQRVVYALDSSYTAGKSFIGDINLVNWEQIPFHSDDFLSVRPTYLFPTDGQKWYLNYQELQAVPPNAYDAGAVLTYQLIPGPTYIIRCTFMYAELE